MSSSTLLLFALQLLIGFSVGDDLGFAQSLTNTDDTDRRRSTSDNGGYPETEQELKRTDVATGRSHSGGSRSPFLAWAGALPGAAGGPPLAQLPGTAGAIAGTAGVVPPFRPLADGANSKDAAVPPFSALPPSIARIPVVRPQPIAPLIYQNSLQMANRRFQIILPNSTDTDGPIKNTIVVGSVEKVPSPLVEVAAPSVGAAQTSSKNIYSATLTNRLQSALHHPVKTSSELASMDIASPSPLLMGHSIQSLSQASNISVEALAAALRLREQQLSTSTLTTLTTTVTPPTTAAPRPTKPATVRPKYPLVGPNRVMNAPKEYYPVSYDQNYDDNFTSKVELPDTSFTCGDQKHFPGLYADEDLGCMVFHVCAFTDDGMVMKSFLCPESTLFDQSILKCNWWFYVDCKASRRLYDSNIPISKSYQLMKALAFFSGYKNQTGASTSSNTT